MGSRGDAEHRLCWTKRRWDRRVYLYVAGPYASDPTANVRAAVEAAEKLIRAGYNVYVPHLNHLWDLVSKHEPVYWLKQDLAWLRRCHAVVRLPGNSPGAELEVQEAQRLGRPVVNMEEALRT